MPLQIFPPTLYAVADVRFENVTVVLCSERVAYPIGSLTFSRANKNNSISADFSIPADVTTIFLVFVLRKLSVDSISSAPAVK